MIQILSDKNLKLQCIKKNRDVCKLVIETTEGTIAIEKKIEGNQQNIRCIITKMKKKIKNQMIKIFLLNFENLESLQNIKENYELIMSLPEVAESSTNNGCSIVK